MNMFSLIFGFKKQAEAFSRGYRFDNLENALRDFFNNTKLFEWVLLDNVKVLPEKGEIYYFERDK
jgi:hypothetical protein